MNWNQIEASIYDGVCPTCGDGIRYFLVLQNTGVVPPPRISCAHQCQLPVVPVDCFYVGPKSVYPTKNQRTE